MAETHKPTYEQALENIRKAVRTNDGDTLSRVTPDGAVLWTASSGWTGSAPVTLGDLRAIARGPDAALPSPPAPR